MKKNFLLTVLLLLTLHATYSKQSRKVKINTYPEGAIVISNAKTQMYRTPSLYYESTLSNEIFLWKKDHMPSIIRRDDIDEEVNVLLEKWKNKFSDTVKYKTCEFHNFFTSDSKIILSNYRDIVSKTLSKNIPGIETPNVAFGSTGKSSRSRLKLAGEIIKISTASRFSGYSNFDLAGIAEIKWSVYDVVLDKVVYEKNHKGVYVEEGKIETTDFTNDVEQTLKNALEEATKAVLFDEAFVAVFEKKDDESTEKDTKVADSEITIIQGELPTYAKKSDLIKEAITSCVTIKNENSFGSGFFITEDGMIMTNYHVIEGAEEVTVVLNQGFELEGKVVYYDEGRDVALVDIPGKKYKGLHLSTEQVPTGEDVFAIGTPVDVSLGQSVSSGIVSGKRKMEDYIFIQTDVSINGGNSGGPLIDYLGNVVGVVVAKRTDAEGIALAIPIQEALDALNITLKKEE